MGKTLHWSCQLTTALYHDHTFGAIGTCWGTYVVIRMSEDVDVKAGISMHLSHPNVAGLLGESEEDLLKAVKSNQFFMPSVRDSNSTKMGGLGKEILGDALDMNHGWTVRGDLGDPIVERDVRKAFNLALAFFGKYLL
jgi:dienelactone hydrolase